MQSQNECRTIQVVSGDGCAALANRCGIAPAQFTEFNSDPRTCSTLQPGQSVCCSSGSLPDIRPRQHADGSCASYAIKSGEYCSLIAGANGISVQDIENFNRNTWGWSGCEAVFPDVKICLSPGDPPMPNPIPNAVCGPQKPGTPSVPRGGKLADMNPCPIKSCCNIWGQCGTTDDFCIPNLDGPPGSAKPGKNSCISNCGSGIRNMDTRPKDFKKIGYFEAWNQDRPCLRMEVSQIDDSYTHIHFAFADITSDFEVSIPEKVQNSFKKFVAMKRTKRIIAFGGWAASTSPTTFNIYREGVKPQNRQRLATNLANFVKQHDLDGIDIDWEYPGAPDIPGIPAADLSNGPDYLELLKLLRQQLSSRSLSIAAPASHWYLKAFSIEEMAKVVDYIIYMTYDLHGQWDWGNQHTSPGCPGGDCLRSHVNMTETIAALGMITKAGVPTYKLIGGIASYGRQFGLTTRGCYGPTCKFHGPQSTAKPGRCTQVPEYISLAEINEIIKNNPTAKTWATDAVDNVLVYDETNWVSFLDEDNKKKRSDFFKSLNLGGTTEWAIDLNTFLPGDDSSLPRNGDGFSLGGQKQSGSLADLLQSQKMDESWKQLDCESKGATTTDDNPLDRWDWLKANAAWAAVVQNWTNSQVTTNRNARQLDFPNYVANFFHGTDGRGCGPLGVNGCQSPEKCMQGKDTGPAGHLIINSFVGINNLYQNYFDAINDASNSVSKTFANFVTTFAPEKPQDPTLQILLGLLQMGLTMGGAAAFNGYLKNLKFFQKNPLLHANLKDSTKDVLSFSIGTVKETLKTGGAVATKKEAMDKVLGSLTDEWKTMVESISQATFSGDAASIQYLTGLIKLGQMLPQGRKQPKMDAEGVVKKTMYTVFIPAAWRIREVTPVILDTTKSCDAIGTGNYRSLLPSVAESGKICVDNKLYYLVSPDGEAEILHRTAPDGRGNRPSSNWKANSLSTVPGINQLKGQDWAGITVQGLGESAVRGKLIWGNRKRDDRLDLSDQATFDSMYDMILIGDMSRAPGAVNIPVCTEPELRKNWKGRKDIYDGYPCNKV
ncbi:glycoside hydrolase [Microthyrium microscopicum]|uniref:chitinase n=1 Tax=Microthyrium microscopicum TaxID=703497 RepID=A0A6A6U7B2_9PEZI|nr:glycoside hydrolase [Microthyrium microscopicum]